MELSRERVVPIIKAALKEDIGKGDITTSSVISKYASIDTTIVVREDCVICGMLIAEWLIGEIDYSVRFKPMCKEGDFLGKGGEVAIIEGRAGSIMRAERTLLNFLAFLSGIATRARKFADAVTPFGVKIADTRKTYPLLRYLEKYAVAVGGGYNHRMGLYDQILIKDNHIRAYAAKNEPKSKKKRTPLGDNRDADPVSLVEIIALAKKRAPRGVHVEIEVDSIEEFRDALSSGPDIIMLDNMRIADVKACVELRRRVKQKPLLEVSGGITLDNVKDYAQCGIDIISSGSLTNAVKSIDMSLEVV